MKSNKSDFIEKVILMRLEYLQKKKKAVNHSQLVDFAMKLANELETRDPNFFVQVYNIFSYPSIYPNTNDGVIKIDNGVIYRKE